MSRRCCSSSSSLSKGCFLTAIENGFFGLPELATLETVSREFAMEVVRQSIQMPCQVIPYETGDRKKIYNAFLYAARRGLPIRTLSFEPLLNTLTSVPPPWSRAKEWRWARRYEQKVSDLWRVFELYNCAKSVTELCITDMSEHHRPYYEYHHLTNSRITSLAEAGCHFEALERLNCWFESCTSEEHVASFFTLLPEGLVKTIDLRVLEHIQVSQHGCYDSCIRSAINTYDVDAGISRSVSPYATKVNLSSHFQMSNATLLFLVQNPRLEHLCYTGHDVEDLAVLQRLGQLRELKSVTLCVSSEIAVASIRMALRLLDAGTTTIFVGSQHLDLATGDVRPIEWGDAVYRRHVVADEDEGGWGYDSYNENYVDSDEEMEVFVVEDDDV